MADNQKHDTVVKKTEVRLYHRFCDRATYYILALAIAFCYISSLAIFSTAFYIREGYLRKLVFDLSNDQTLLFLLRQYNSIENFIMQVTGLCLCVTGCVLAMIFLTIYKQKVSVACRVQ